jgi:hypothetical protein
MVPQGGDERPHGARVAYLAERPGGVHANVLVTLPEGGDERLHGRGANVAESVGGSLADIPIPEGGDERLHGRGAHLSERRYGSLADPALRMSERPDQPRDVSFGSELAGVWLSETQRGAASSGTSLTRTERHVE